jgi:hypothetical protein
MMDEGHTIRLQEIQRRHYRAEEISAIIPSLSLVAWPQAEIQSNRALLPDMYKRDLLPPDIPTTIIRVYLT